MHQMFRPDQQDSQLQQLRVQLM